MPAVAGPKPFGLQAFCLLLAIVGTTARAAAPAPTFAEPFGSHMVLPHGQRLTLRGLAAPGSQLTLAIGTTRYSLRSDARGEWQQSVQPLHGGGPYTLTLTDDTGAGTTLTDVLAGEVWLCSGQSNMELSAGASTDQPAGMMQGHPAIRLLGVAHQTALQPRDAFTEKPAWQDATSDSVRRFSALCWFFARQRIEDTGLPIGIVSAAWGGSSIQPWIGEARLAKLPAYARQVQQLRDFRSEPRRAELAFADTWVNWWRSASPLGDVWQRGVLDGSPEWQTAPLADWRTYTDPRLKNFTGNLWFSASFELTEAQSRKGASFVLGKIDEVDTTWLNGRFVGNTFGYGSRREYRLEPGMLRAGTNQFSVFVTNTYDAGGMTGPEADVGIRFDDGGFIALGDRWKYRVVPKQTGYPPRAPWESVAGISGMFNGMIAPLRALPPTGVIWYQGESNADSPGDYGPLLTALVQDWRAWFNRPLPFIVVQLPNYGAIATTPRESGWAQLRNAQQQVALADARIGLVVTQDLGNDADIHPRLKYAVAVRAARVARAMDGAGGAADGIVARVAATTATGLRLEFDSPLLPAAASPTVAGFELCADAPGSCVAVAGVLRDGGIEIDRAALPGATRIRWCWSDGGTCALRGVNGLPVASFELPLAGAGRRAR